MRKKTMQLKQLYFSDKQLELLHKEMKEKGYTFSELVRKCINDYLFKTK